MLKKIILALLVIPFASSAKAQDGGSKSLGEFLYTVPIKKQFNLTDIRVNWWHEHLEWDANDSLLQALSDRIDSGKIKVYFPQFPFDKEIPINEVQELLRPGEDVEDIDAGGNVVFKTMRAYRFYADEVIAITFYEEWFFNENTNELKKKVKGLILNKDKIDTRTGDRIGMVPMFYIPMQTTAGMNLNKSKVSGLTYDLAFKDSSGLKGGIESEKGKVKELLNAVNKKYSASITTPLYDTIYPYCNALKDPEYATRLKQLGRANNIRFVEDWNFDVDKLSFEKNVKGIVLTEEKNGAENKISRRRIAYVPLNANIPTTIFADDPKLNVDYIRPIYQFNYSDKYQYELPKNKLVSIKNRTLGVLLFQQAKEHKIKIYDSYRSDPRRNIFISLSVKDADHIFTWIDTVVESVEDINTGMIQEIPVAKTHELDYFNIGGYNIHESWEFDPKQMIFEKKCRSVGMLYSIDDLYSGERKGYRTLFQVILPPVVDKQQLMVTEYSIGRNIVTTVRINENEISSLDEGYDLNTIISISETDKNDIPPSKRYPFINGILKGVMNGSIVAYDTTQNDPKVMSAQQITSRIESMKGSLIPKGDINGLYSMVDGIEFTEDWYFNPNNDQFYRKVKSISLVKMEINNDEKSADYRQWVNKKIFTLHLN